jgi:hypothetical protein
MRPLSTHGPRRRISTLRFDDFERHRDDFIAPLFPAVRDGFLADDRFPVDRFDLSDERLSGIMRELEVDRDRITRILSVLEDERTKLQKR